MVVAERDITARKRRLDITKFLPQRAALCPTEAERPLGKLSLSCY
jgi:hypothetical protein